MKYYQRYCRNGLLLKVSISIFLYLEINTTTKGQYFVTNDMPCPIGDKVELDTVFYTPNVPLPFDRCFYLKFMVGNTQTVKYFSISPIDKMGKQNPSRRDYRVFWKSSFPDKSQRKKNKKREPYTKWKNSSPFKTLYTQIFRTPKGTKHELILRMPPLDPNREYRLYLINDDMEVINELLQVGELIVNAHLGAGPADPAILSNAQRKYQKSLNRSKKSSVAFMRRDTFETFKGYVGSFDFELKNTDAAVNSVIERRILLLPATSYRDIGRYDPPQCSSEYFWHTKSDSDPVRIKVIPSPGKFDMDGNTFDAFQTGEYKVGLLEVYKKDSTGRVTDSKFEIMGLLNIYDSGLKREFTASAEGTKHEIKLTQGPLKQYFARITNANDLNLSTQYNEKYFACLDKGLLNELMNVAIRCPCEEIGVKDLTQKDELSSLISILFENNGELMQKFVQGFLSMKDPGTPATDTIAYAKRQVNLNMSISQVRLLADFARKVMTQNGSRLDEYANLLNCLEGFQTYLGKVAAILKKTADNEDNLRTDLINKFQPISAAQLGIGSTSLMDMKSDTKFRIVPDFGFILPFTKGQAGFLQDFTPYMGFNVNFRSMDKNIKLRQIRYKSLRHYLSFSAGLTMRSLKIDKKRDDFFDKTSLITGLGIRLSNYLRLTGGVVWFKVPDPNVITNNTLVRLTPFVGLSVDVDLIELFGGIKTLFK